MLQCLPFSWKSRIVNVYGGNRLMAKIGSSNEWSVFRDIFGYFLFCPLCRIAKGIAPWKAIVSTEICVEDG